MKLIKYSFCREKLFRRFNYYNLHYNELELMQAYLKFKYYQTTETTYIASTEDYNI